MATHRPDRPIACLAALHLFGCAADRRERRGLWSREGERGRGSFKPSERKHNFDSTHLIFLHYTRPLQKLKSYTPKELIVESMSKQTLASIVSDIMIFFYRAINDQLTIKIKETTNQNN